MTTLIPEHVQKNDIFESSILDLSNPQVLLETLQKLRQIVIQDGRYFRTVATGYNVIGIPFVAGIAYLLEIILSLAAGALA